MKKAKYKNAILYFSETIPSLGRTKLYKLLYYLDFDHFEKYGEAVTKDTYINLDLGPVPAHAEDVVCEMVSEGLIDIVPVTVGDYVRYEYINHQRHDPSVFNHSEIEMLCDVKEKWFHHSAREIVAATHGEAPWIATRKGEEIPYPLAYYRGKFESPSYDEEPLEQTLAT